MSLNIITKQAQQSLCIVMNNNKPALGDLIQMFIQKTRLHHFKKTLLFYDMVLFSILNSLRLKDQ